MIPRAVAWRRPCGATAAHSSHILSWKKCTTIIIRHYYRRCFRCSDDRPTDRPVVATAYLSPVRSCTTAGEVFRTSGPPQAGRGQGTMTVIGLVRSPENIIINNTEKPPPRPGHPFVPVTRIPYALVEDETADDSEAAAPHVGRNVIRGKI